MNIDYSKIFRLDGQRALVIGAGSGIGREAALALGAHGAHVICADLDLDHAKQTAALIVSAEALELDVLGVGEIARLAETINTLDVCVHTPAMNVRKAILDYTLEELALRKDIEDLKFTHDLYNSDLRAECFDIKTRYEQAFASQGELIKYLRFKFS